MLRNFRKVFSKRDSEEEDKVPEPVEFDTEGECLCQLNEIQLLSGHTNIVRILLKIDDRRFVSASDDSTINVWDAKTGKKLLTLAEHTLPVTCLLLQQTNKNEPPILISGSSDKTIRMWDLENGNCYRVMKNHNGSVKCLTALENGKFSSGGNDDVICIWNDNGHPSLPSPTIKRNEPEHLNCMLLIRNQKLVAASDSTLIVYNLQTCVEHKVLSSPATSKVHREAIRNLCQVSEGLFASASLDGSIVLWTTHTLSPLRILNVQLSYQDQELHAFPYSVQHMVPLGERYLLAAIGMGFSLFDVLTGDCLIKCPKAHHSTVQYIMTLYNNERIVTCSADSSIRIWAPDTTDTRGDFSHPHTPTSPSTPTKGVGKQPENLSGLETFFPKTSRSRSPSTKPVCIGELIAHTESVNSLIQINEYSFVSCGSDGLLVSWKDGLIETQRRNEMAQKFISMYDPFEQSADLYSIHSDQKPLNTSTSTADN